jgi:hypothetical protein
MLRIAGADPDEIEMSQRFAPCRSCVHRRIGSVYWRRRPAATVPIAKSFVAVQALRFSGYLLGLQHDHREMLGSIIPALIPFCFS